MTSLATAVGRPQPGEYAPYYEKYIVRVEGNDILATLGEQSRQTLLLLSGRSESDGDLRYAPGKWTVREVIGHICDVERIMSYRALRIARADATPLPGFDENAFVANGGFANRVLRELAEDFAAVRQATLSLLRSLDESAWLRRGSANNQEVTVRALAYIISGHELHHRRLLEEKYFVCC